MTSPQPSAGALPLTARLEPWMERLVNNPEECAQLIKAHGSPVNVHEFSALKRNIDELKEAAGQAGVQLNVYVARKANKTLGLIDAARNCGAGVDVASKRELEQCLDRGVPGSRIILTAAVKSPSALVSALEAMAIISVDNVDELEVVTDLAEERGIEAQVALRLAVTAPNVAPTRFGMPADTWAFALTQLGSRRPLKVRGVHFHLNGYSADERVLGLREALSLVDRLKAAGHQPTFIDIGGGIPMRYLEDPQQWNAFWTGVQAGTVPQQNTVPPAPATAQILPLAASPAEQNQTDPAVPNTAVPNTAVPNTVATSCWGLPLPTTAVAEEPAPLAQLTDSGAPTEGAAQGIPTQATSDSAPALATQTLATQTLATRAVTSPTWRGDTLGLVDPTAERPSPQTYPFYQASVRGPWLSHVLAGEGLNPATTIAQELIHRDLELRCEPGRAVLDGCGMTLAEVAFRKEASDHTPLVGLFMNRTQLRTTSADLLVDPIHVRPSNASAPVPVGRGFLVGAYCIEDELIIRRAMDFPQGVARGDIFAFPNTAGYFMHIVESASHQLPLAANLVFDQSIEGLTDAEVQPSHWVVDDIDAVNPAGGERLS